MKYSKAIIKLNNGNGALLCNKCSEIVAYGFDHEDKKHLCERCEKGGPPEPHTCPFAEDIDGDHETLCNCCSNCERECADDI